MNAKGEVEEQVKVCKSEMTETQRKSRRGGGKSRERKKKEERRVCMCGGESRKRKT